MSCTICILSIHRSHKRTTEMLGLIKIFNYVHTRENKKGMVCTYKLFVLYNFFKLKDPDSKNSKNFFE